MTTPRESKRIDSIKIKRIYDDSPDASYLGEWSDDPGDYAIVAIGEHDGVFVDQLPCEYCGKLEANCDNNDHGFDSISIERGREYRYFNPNADNYQGEPDADIRKYCLQDYKRMRALANGDWCYIGIQATSEIVIKSIVQTIHSSGLWGIESDSGEAEIHLTEKEQLEELRDQLHAVGFSKRAIAAAMRNLERDDL